MPCRQTGGSSSQKGFIDRKLEQNFTVVAMGQIPKEIEQGENLHSKQNNGERPEEVLLKVQWLSSENVLYRLCLRITGQSVNESHSARQTLNGRIDPPGN